jgi:transcriptional regulator with XRE-family HTH domain
LDPNADPDDTTVDDSPSAIHQILERELSVIPDLETLTQDSSRQREIIRSLRSFREHRGLSQEDVGKAMRTGQPSIARLESGEIDPKISTLARYARALGLVLDWVVRPDLHDLQAAAALEAKIEERVSTDQVRDELGNAFVYALGSPAGDTSAPGKGTEADLLHFEADDDVVYLPIFTRVDLMRTALLNNPDWQTLSILEISGGDLMANVDDDVALAINPWTDIQCVLPSRLSTGSTVDVQIEEFRRQLRQLDISAITLTEPPKAAQAESVLEGL